MADITKLNMTFVDGDTVIYASTLNAFQSKINELVDAVNVGVRPSPTPSPNARNKTDMEYVFWNTSTKTIVTDPTQARRVKLIAHVDAGASINASTTYVYGFYGAACTLYDTRDNALYQNKGAIESIAADGAGVVNGTFSASGWIVLVGVAGSGSNYFTQTLSDSFYDGANVTITDP